MKMDRNTTDDGLGKYAVINLRRLNETCSSAETFQRWSPEVQAALDTLESVGVLEWGRTGEPDEFFLIKLKDVNAEHALIAYADQVNYSDKEFAGEVYELAKRAGANSPYCKHPD
jgi:hypothetical protein